ncbi:hypothetical protein E2I00_017049 [Balaenoptera physalus]|uniref:Calcium-responsive transactivator n=1 Tax=Balaenoptera physalus TaxID=9770 RepID=A0A6A1Q824_BALPH|nr:hypothetical protein E2I00_017049 [Balaenoptera physalus]
MQSLLPAVSACRGPPTQSLALGPGGLSQSGSGQGLHSQGSLSDAIGAGLPPSSLMQAQIGNGSSQQYLGQEEYYGGEQYGHGQAASEPMSQQYYPDGHGDYAYQPASYTEQSYDRSFEESAQHYYEGGNSQYSQQQAGYQQGTAQQQTYSQQQYPNQQSYPGQQQGYGPAQGAPSQYSSYQQGQGQQYGSYRASQTGPSAQQQRPYGYEQASLLRVSRLTAPVCVRRDEGFPCGQEKQ